jgi:uncharacterized membrane protein
LPAEFQIADVVGYVGALSGDGRVVVVNQPTQSADHRGYLWLPDTDVLQRIPASGNEDAEGSWFTSTTDDGSEVFGYFLEANTEAEGGQALRWTSEGGLQQVEGLRAILAVSGDGSTLLGRTRDFGALKIGNDLIQIPTVGVSSAPVTLSRDGTTVAGQAYLETGPSTRNAAFVWSPGEEALSLDTPTDYAQATCLSGDGSILFGFSYYEVAEPEARFRAFRWSEGSGYEELGNFGPSAASGDGSVVVGTRWVDGRGRGVVWDSERGARDLDDELDTLGLDRQGASISGATAVSEDGRTVAGTATILALDHVFRTRLP